MIIAPDIAIQIYLGMAPHLRRALTFSADKKAWGTSTFLDLAQKMPILVLFNSFQWLICG